MRIRCAEPFPPYYIVGHIDHSIAVEIAGQTIANIYDYTYALELLKIDQPVKVVYMRGSEKRETTLTPGARR